MFLYVFVKIVELYVLSNELSHYTDYPIWSFSLTGLFLIICLVLLDLVTSRKWTILLVKGDFWTSKQREKQNQLHTFLITACIYLPSALCIIVCVGLLTQSQWYWLDSVTSWYVAKSTSSCIITVLFVGGGERIIFVDEQTSYKANYIVHK